MKFLMTASDTLPAGSLLDLFRIVARIEGKTLELRPTRKAVPFHPYGGPEVLLAEVSFDDGITWFLEREMRAIRGWLAQREASFDVRPQSRILGQHY